MINDNIGRLTESDKKESLKIGSFSIHELKKHNCNTSLQGADSFVNDKVHIINFLIFLCFCKFIIVAWVGSRFFSNVSIFISFFPSFFFLSRFFFFVGSSNLEIIDHKTNNVSISLYYSKVLRINLHNIKILLRYGEKPRFKSNYSACKNHISSQVFLFIRIDLKRG